MTLKDRIEQNKNKDKTCGNCKYFEMLKTCGYCNKKDKLIMLEYPPNNIDTCIDLLEE